MARAAASHAQRTKQLGLAGIRTPTVVQVEKPDAIAAINGLVELGTVRQRPANGMMAWSNVRRECDGVALGAAIGRGMRQRRHASKENGQLQLHSYCVHRRPLFLVACFIVGAGRLVVVLALAVEIFN